MATAASYFNREFQIDNLQIVYDKHISGTSALGIDRINRAAFELKLQKELSLINRKTLDGSYKFSQYQEKLISKGAGKYPRVISIPTFRDRLVLRGICNLLRHVYAAEFSQKIPQHVISSIKDALSSNKFSYFVKVDITNFYPTIDHQILLKALKRKVRKVEIISLIEKAISSSTTPFPDKSKPVANVGVPQGLAISNILAEIFLQKLDEKMLRDEGIAYFRYVDDVLILCKEDPSRLFAKLESEFLTKYSLKVHPLGEQSKSRFDDIDESFSFLGYKFADGKAEVKKDSIQRLEGSLAKIFTTYKYKKNQIDSTPDGPQKIEQLRKSKVIFLWRLNLRITGCIFEGARKGWIFYFSQIDISNIKQLRKLDNTVSTLALRFGVAISSSEKKSFLRTYFESKHKDNAAQKYIPNFDTTSESMQRKILADYFGFENINNYTSKQVLYYFNSKIRRATQELEHDIQDVS